MSKPPLNVDVSPIADRAALATLEYDFETSRIYTVHKLGSAIFAIELIERKVDPPLYKNYSPSRMSTELESSGGGFKVSVDGELAAAVVLSFEEWRSVAHIDDLLVGRKFRRHGLGTLLLDKAKEWALGRGCWALSAETQNVNYPAVQFYRRNGFEIWSVNEHFYPPGEYGKEIAVVLGKIIA